LSDQSIKLTNEEFDQLEQVLRQQQTHRKSDEHDDDDRKKQQL
jgi:hypothetical protein